MFKKILVIPLGVGVLIFTIWALNLALPGGLPLPLQLLLSLILLFPPPLLPLAAALPAGKVRTYVHRVGEAVTGPYLYLLILLVLDALLCVLSYFTGAFTVSLPVMSALTVTVWFFILLWGALNARIIKKRHYTIVLPCKDGKEGQTRAVLLSDLHLGYFSTKAFLKRLVGAVNNAAPHYVFIAGDLLDSDMSELSEKKEAPTLLKSIDAPQGVYLCMGNHDLYAANDPSFYRFIDRTGFTLLHDEARSFALFTLIGRSEVHEKERMKQETLFQSTDGARIVLCHNPKEGEELIKAGADLVLCGHTHNGQTFPGNIVSKMKSRYSYGLNRYRHGAVLTTSGAGYWGPPLRIFTNNEIVILDLIFQKADPSVAKA